MSPFAFGRNNVDYNQGYVDGFKWSQYDYTRKPGPEYDAGFMAGYFEKNGRPFEGETYTQRKNAYDAQQYQENSYYAQRIFGDANPFTIKTTAILKAFLALVIISVISFVFNEDKPSQQENMKSDNSYQTQELNYSSKAQKPNELLNEQGKNKPTENTLSNSSEITVDFKPYMRDLQSRIKMNWSPPISGRDKTVEILFKISKDGRLLSYEIQKSSGITEVDRAAVQAIQLTAPFRPLPEGFKGDSIDILFTFDYHKIQ